MCRLLTQNGSTAPVATADRRHAHSCDHWRSQTQGGAVGSGETRTFDLSGAQHLNKCGDDMPWH